MDLDLLRPEFPSNYTFYTEAATVAVLLIVGLFANVPLIFIYIRSKLNRSVADKFLFNILISDILSLGILLPTILFDLIINHTAEERYSSADLLKEIPTIDLTTEWSCIFKKSFLSGIATASILGALLISMERYLVIVTPLHYHKLLTRPAVITTSAIGLAIAIGSAVMSSLDPCEPVFPSCAKTTIAYTESMWWPTYTLIHVSVFFILPVCLMAFIYMRIWCEARRQIAKINEQCKNPFFLSDRQELNEQVEKGKRRVLLYPLVLRAKILNRLKAAKMDRAARASILTLSATIICWSPYYYVQSAHAIRSIFEQMGGNLRVLENWNHWDTTLPLLFASLHPVLEAFFYAYRYKRLRDEVLKVLHLEILFQFFRFRWQRGAEVPIEKYPNKCQAYPQPITTPDRPISKIYPMHWIEESRPQFHIGEFENESVDGDMQSFPSPTELSIPTVNHPSSVTLNDPESGSDVAVPLDESMTDAFGLKATFHWIGKSATEFISLFRKWYTSYSKQWRGHRESVTSNSSVVTLISSRWSTEQINGNQV